MDKDGYTAVTPDLVVFYRTLNSINRSELAREMGYSATYLRMIELKQTAITPIFAHRFVTATKLTNTEMTQLKELHKQALAIVDK